MDNIKEMALQSTIQIFIGGVPIPTYKKIRLHQEIGAYHILELICRMDVLEELSGEIASESKNYLWDTLTLKISSLDNVSEYKELEFISITHTSTENEKYQNHFIGTTTDLDIYSNTDMIAFPKSESQVVTVKKSDSEKIDSL